MIHICMIFIHCIYVCTSIYSMLISYAMDILSSYAGVLGSPGQCRALHVAPSFLGWWHWRDGLCLRVSARFLADWNLKCMYIIYISIYIYMWIYIYICKYIYMWILNININVYGIYEYMILTWLWKFKHGFSYGSESYWMIQKGGWFPHSASAGFALPFFCFPSWWIRQQNKGNLSGRMWETQW